MRRINLVAKEISDRLDPQELAKRPLNDEETRAVLTLCVVLRLRLTPRTWEKIEQAVAEARKDLEVIQTTRTS